MSRMFIPYPQQSFVYLIINVTCIHISAFVPMDKQTGVQKQCACFFECLLRYNSLHVYWIITTLLHEIMIECSIFYNFSFIYSQSLATFVLLCTFNFCICVFLYFLYFFAHSVYYISFIDVLRILHLLIKMQDCMHFAEPKRFNGWCSLHENDIFTSKFRSCWTLCYLLVFLCAMFELSSVFWFTV